MLRSSGPPEASTGFGIRFFARARPLSSLKCGLLSASLLRTCRLCLRSQTPSTLKICLPNIITIATAVAMIEVTGMTVSGLKYASIVK